ncbi:hypothetical protein [Aliarcobacter butzleri]|uniref:Uncharacterized protein n=1 Tax=Aliarcobacter butzleri TaxID=28197 RepID=A0AAW7PRA1_9BACT|nr:hypothetical protein [Aliarcobacter butzleri]MDN5063916.1 hypothetical protein [Aliarcobacter butzleri]MDN5065150.1 hypothetical protein [Aliarcobacter butzleri]
MENKEVIKEFIKEVYKIIENNQNLSEGNKKELVKKEVERRILK